MGGQATAVSIWLLLKPLNRVIQTVRQANVGDGSKLPWLGPRIHFARSFQIFTGDSIKDE
jgi:hypothetical protein